MTLVSLQFNGDGDLVLDDGNPIYDRPPTGDLYMAIAQRLGSFHADPLLGSTVPDLVSGEPHGGPEIKNAITLGLQRLEVVGVIVVDEVLVFVEKNLAQVYTSATDQPFVVNL